MNSGDHRAVGRALLSGFGCACLELLALVSPAGAQEPVRSTYEQQRLDRVLYARGLRREREPAGKRISRIDVVRDEVFIDHDLVVPVALPSFAPTWPNVLHWLTREEVVRRELLVEVGQPYEDALVEESMRNLRATGTLALVRIVAVQTGSPDEVALVVYTRDLWSLRLETPFSGAGKSGRLTVQLVERNLFGRNKQAAVRFDIRPKSFSFGESYYDRRLLGGELQLYESFDGIFNLETGSPEGSQGRLSLSRPFHNLAQRFSYQASVDYAVFVNRVLSDTEYTGLDLDTGEPCEPGRARCARQVWDDSQVAVTASGSYRRGLAYRQTFTLGAGYRNRAVEPNGETALEAGEAADFRRQVLPRVRREVFPYFRYLLSLPNFEVFENLGTLGRSENVQTGPMLDGALEFPIEAFGSSASAIVAGGMWAYVWADHDALFDVELRVRARWEEGRALDQRLSFEAKGATPPWLAGRLVARALWVGRRNDTANTQVTIGGDNGLRGYVSQAFRVVGGNQMLGNVEYRTLPLVVASVHLGGVLFYDAGAVYKSLDGLAAHHTAGVGVRLLFPQLNRYVFRLDVGAPLDQDGFAVQLSYGGDQVIQLSAAEEAAANSDIRAQ